MYTHLSSSQNPLIKNVGVLLTKSRERKKQGLFVAEGIREVKLALENGFEVTHLLFDPIKTSDDILDKILKEAKVSPTEIISTSTEVFKKVSYRSTVANVVAVCKAPKQSSESFKPTNPKRLILVLEGMQKPGNFGAMLRTADAAGVDAVLLCEPQFDLYNPNAIRASLGAIFTLPIIEKSSKDAASWLRGQNVKIFATWLEAAKPLYNCDLTQPSALVLGAEADGITPFWVEQADEHIIIPMTGQVDSLNVASSAAVVLFEAVRQRAHK